VVVAKVQHLTHRSNLGGIVMLRCLYQISTRTLERCVICIDPYPLMMQMCGRQKKSHRETTPCGSPRFPVTCNTGRLYLYSKGLFPRNMFIRFA
jgi:hypothetical protein